MNKKFLFTGLIGLLFIFASCEEKEKVVLESIKSPVLKAPGIDALVLNPDVAQEAVLELEWEPAEYNLAVEVNYRIELAKKGTDFADRVVLGSTTETSLDIIGFDLNRAMTISLGLPIADASDVEIRVSAFVGTHGPNASNAFSFSAFTYDPPYTPEVFKLMSEEDVVKEFTLLDEFVGDGVTDVDETGLYEGYVWLSGDNLSLTLVGGDERAVQFGAASAEASGDHETIYSLEEGDEPIVVAAEGYYLLRLDMNSQELSLYYTEWGVIGTATPGGWSDSTPMEYDADADVWRVELTSEGGTFKFRANDEWAFAEYGDNDADGILNQGGSDIPTSIEGQVQFTLDLSSYPYTYSFGAAK